MNEPLISVIIPTYNYALYITEAIKSILQQNYPPDKIEIIVVDDGSRDNTHEVLKQFQYHTNIRCFFQQNKGKSNATFNAIQQCNGKYIFNLDADDYFLPGKILKTVEVFESDETIIHVASPAEYILSNNTHIKEPIPAVLLNKKLNGNYVLNYLMHSNLLYGGGSTYAARATILKKIIIPDSIDMYTDEFLILTTLPYGDTFFIDECLSVWRGHNLNYSGTSKTSSTKIQKGERMLASCNSVLAYLEDNGFDKKLLRLYRLKNLTLKISHKEVSRKKRVSDILNYAFNVFFKIRPNLHLLKKYHVLNRLIPTPLFNVLKDNVVKPRRKMLLTD